MTPAQATELLTSVLASRAEGATWRQLMVKHGCRSPQEMKKLAKEAAKVSQRFLLESTRGES